MNIAHHSVARRQEELQERQRANINEISRNQVEVEARLREQVPLLYFRFHFADWTFVIRLQSLDDANVRKLKELEKWDKDCHDAIIWLRKDCNKQKFRMEVFEPPFISLTVPDKKYVNAIEACFNANQLKVAIDSCVVTVISIYSFLLLARLSLSSAKKTSRLSTIVSMTRRVLAERHASVHGSNRRLKLLFLVPRCLVKRYVLACTTHPSSHLPVPIAR